LTDVSGSAPLAADFSQQVVALNEEVGRLLSSDRWALLTLPHVLPRAYQGAALRHYCSLLLDIDDARVLEREVRLRLLARAHLEAWMVAMFLFFGGYDALVEVAGDYRYNAQAQQHSFDQYNAHLAAEIKNVTKRNETIRAANANRGRWNANHPEERHLDMIDELPLPTRTPIELDLSDHLAMMEASGVPPAKLPLATLADRLNALSRESEGGDPTFDTTYSVAYRSLSSLGGAHPTIWVLQTYLSQEREDGFFVRTEPTTQPPSSMAASICRTALMTTAYLATRVCGGVGQETPTADEIVEACVKTVTEWGGGGAAADSASSA
jgi:hypothetical protein